MHYDNMQLDISEWSTENPEEGPSAALNRLLNFLRGRGYVSLEYSISQSLEQFIGISADQRDFTWDPHKGASVLDATEIAMTTCVKKGDCLLFIDTEMLPTEKIQLGDKTFKFGIEVDIFAADNLALKNCKESLLEDIMKAFGLTKSKDQLLRWKQQEQPLLQGFRSKLVKKEYLADDIAKRVKEKEDRIILRELKRRTFLLERDIRDLQLNIDADRIKTTLDYFSGQEYRLVERKYAIICRQANEIIFLMRTRDDIESAKSLECPKCGRPIGQEDVNAHYGITEGLRALLDNSRWMPLLVRDALVRAGVPIRDIEIEVKYGQDEIDVMAFYKGRVLICELKDRAVNLNDAYKLSAKTSRIETVLSRSEIADLVEFTSALPASLHRQAVPRRAIKLRPGAQPLFFPIIISADEIAQDAKDLLSETRDTAICIERSEESLDAAIQQLITGINNVDLRDRFKELVDTDEADSVSALAARHIDHALTSWITKG